MSLFSALSRVFDSQEELINRLKQEREELLRLLIVLDIETDNAKLRRKDCVNLSYFSFMSEKLNDMIARLK